MVVFSNELHFFPKKKQCQKHCNSLFSINIEPDNKLKVEPFSLAYCGYKRNFESTYPY